MAVYARLKKEFMEDEKYHNLMTCLKSIFVYCHVNCWLQIPVSQQVNTTMQCHMTVTIKQTLIFSSSKDIFSKAQLKSCKKKKTARDLSPATSWLSNWKTF